MNSDRRNEIEEWWTLVSRILSFMLGGVILAYETLFEQVDRPILLLVAAGLMGPMVAAGVSQVIASWKGGSDAKR